MAKTDTTGSKPKAPYWVNVNFINKNIANELFYNLLEGKITVAEFQERFFNAPTMKSNNGFSMYPSNNKKDAAILAKFFQPRIDFVEQKLTDKEWDWEKDKDKISKMLSVYKIVRLEVKPTHLVDKFSINSDAYDI